MAGVQTKKCKQTSPNGQDIEWEVIRNHKSDLLTQDFVLGGFYKYCDMSKYGASFKVPFVKYNHQTGDIFWSKAHMDELRGLSISDSVCGQLIIDIENSISKYKKYLEEFKKEINKPKSDPKVIIDWFGSSQPAVVPVAYFVFEESMARIIKEKGLSFNDVPSSKTDITEFSKKIAKLKSLYKHELRSFDSTSKELKEEVGLLVKRYDYLGMKFFGGNPWTKKDVFLMIKESNVKEDEEYTDHNPIVDDPFLNKLSRLLELRTMQWEAMCYGTYLFREYIIKHFSSKFRYESLLGLTIDEVISLVSSGYINTNNDRENYIVTIDKVGYKVDFSSKTNDVDIKQGEIPSLIGLVAFPGVVRGKAKIVMSPKDSCKIEKGDILVATMSTPDFLPAMQKASAFVTDIGGITSHAAIVARELKKPCIIGTKIATKIFKDGDMIEVDADNGIVRKIQN